jgi:putative endonuclease
MIFTYLAQSESDDSFYVGISENPDKRMVEHNSGKLRSTSKKRPWKLAFVKKHKDYSEARKHEKWLKKKNREYKMKLAQFAPPIRDGVKRRGEVERDHGKIEVPGSSPGVGSRR